MIRTLFIALITLFSFAGSALAGPCDTAKREMAFGEAATEDAKDKAGLKRAAEEFNKAVRKAPNCAAAFFNLGVVQEKSGELVAAKAAYEQYLKLAPSAPDAESVEQQVFKLEYRIQQAAASSMSEKSSLSWNKLAGRWCQVSTCGSGRSSYELTINESQIDISKQHEYVSPHGCWGRYRDNYSGRISSNGSIKGTYIKSYIVRESRCVSGSGRVNEWNNESVPFTGKIVGDGAIIELQWMQNMGKKYGWSPTDMQLRRY